VKGKEKKKPVGVLPLYPFRGTQEKKAQPPCWNITKKRGGGCPRPKETKNPGGPPTTKAPRKKSVKPGGNVNTRRKKRECKKKKTVLVILTGKPGPKPKKTFEDHRKHQTGKKGAGKGKKKIGGTKPGKRVVKG